MSPNSICGTPSPGVKYLAMAPLCRWPGQMRLEAWGPSRQDSRPYAGDPTALPVSRAPSPGRGTEDKRPPPRNQTSVSDSQLPGRSLSFNQPPGVSRQRRASGLTEQAGGVKAPREAQGQRPKGF